MLTARSHYLFSTCRLDVVDVAYTVIAYLNSTHIVAIAPRLELNRHNRKSHARSLRQKTLRDFLERQLARDAGTRAEFRMRGPGASDEGHYCDDVSVFGASC